MGRLALIDWIESAPQAEDGTRFWRPDLPPGIGAWSAFDLRGLGSTGAIVYARDIDSFGAKGSRFDLGGAFTEGLTAGRANQLGNRLGRTIDAGTTPLALIADIAGGRLATVDVGGGRLRRVVRMLDQRYELPPVVRGGAVDDFNRGNGGLGSNWTTCQAAMAIDGNKVVIGANPSSMFYTGTFANDQYSQAACTCSVSGFYMVSVIVRASPANGAEFYFCRLCGSCGDAALGKRVAFSQSEFANGGSISTSVPVTSTLRLEVSGSGLEAFVGGSSVVTSTDTDLTAGNPGIQIATSNTTDASIDDFDGGDLSSPITQNLSGSITPTGALALAATLYPIIVSSADTSATAGPVTVNMPGSIVAGNVLIAMISTDAGVTATQGGGQGWTSITDTAQSTNVRLVILAKIAAGSDALTLTLGTSQDCAVHVMQIGRHGVTSVTTDIKTGTAVAQGTANTSPDPPSVTPAAAVPNLIIACNASDDDDNTSPYAPTNYTAQAQVESAQSTSSCMMQVAVRRLATGAAENPGVFTLAAAEEWVAQTLCIPPAPSGTTFTQSPTGSITPTGALVRQTQKRATGASTPTGVLVRSTAKAVAGAVTPAGVVRKLTTKAPFAGAIATSGALGVLRLITRTLTGLITPAGVLGRVPAKVLTGNVTPAAVVRRDTTKAHTATVTPGGALGKLTVHTRAGAVATSGALLRAVGKPLTGAIATSGALARQRTMARAFAGLITPTGIAARVTSKPLAGALSPAGIVSRVTGKPVAGTVTPAATMTRAAGKVLGGTVAPVGSTVKLTVKAAFAGGVTPSAVLSVARVVLRSFAGAVTPTGALSRQVMKGMGGTLTPGSMLARLTSKRAAGTLTPGGSLTVTRAMFLTLTGSITPTGTLGRGLVYSRAFAGLITPAGFLGKLTAHTRTGTVSPAGHVSRGTSIRLAGAVTPTGSTARYTARALTGAIAPTGALRKLTERTLTGLITPTSVLTRATGALNAVWSIVRASVTDRTRAGTEDRSSAVLEDRSRAGPVQRRVTPDS